MPTPAPPPSPAGGTGHPPEAKHLQHAEPTKKGRQDNGAVEHTPLMKQ